MKGIFENMCDDHRGEAVGHKFFSSVNVAKIQELIKQRVYADTNHKYELVEDQDANDILVAMRAVYKIYGRYLPMDVNRQVENLNTMLVNYVVPDMITEIKQYYGYLKDINEPIKPIDRPINSSSAGRRTLPSISRIFR